MAYYRTGFADKIRAGTHPREWRSARYIAELGGLKGKEVAVIQYLRTLEGMGEVESIGGNGKPVAFRKVPAHAKAQNPQG